MSTGRSEDTKVGEKGKPRGKLTREQVLMTLGSYRGQGEHGKEKLPKTNRKVSCKNLEPNKQEKPRKGTEWAL